MADKELFGISEQLDCADCVNHGGDWDCDHVHCRKGTDTISRQAAIQTAEQMYKRCDTSSIEDYHDLMVEALTALPSAQPEWTTDVNDILAYLDGVVHPLVSPENWNVYSELYDMVSGLLKPWEGR